MSKSFQTAIGPTLMATFAVVGCLAIFAPGPGVFGVPEAQAGSPSTLAAAPALSASEDLPLKGGPCFLLEWPNYEQSCQFDLRQPAGETPVVRIIAVR